MGMTGQANRWHVENKLKTILSFIMLFTLFWYPAESSAQKLTPEMLGKPREEIRFTDNQLRLFNGRGCVYVKENCLTGLHRVQFPPIDISQYQFRLDIRDDRNGILMQDNIPELWEAWKETKSGYDPLGVNFRAGYPHALLSQNEYWKPNLYSREGTYHKKQGKHWVSFAVETETMVSGDRDEVYLMVRVTNRGDQPLSFTMIPVQLVRFEDPSSTDNKQIYQRRNPFVLENSHYRISLSSDLKESNADGWKWRIPAKSTKTARFAIRLQPAGNKQPDRYLADIEQRMQDAQQATRKRLWWAAEKLPVLKTEHKRLDDFYRRSILTVAECKWERENFIVNPFWSAGSWLYTIPWDICFLSDMLSMMSPESMRETIGLSFSEKDLVCSNMGWDGCAPGVFYIMQPFALKMMIDAYLRQTGDTEFLNEKMSGQTILYWMKAWGDMLANDFTSKTSGMVDIGHDTEALVEIRTDGYDYVVPVLNGHAVEYYRWLGFWCDAFNDADSAKFNRRAADLEKRFHENLWNAEKRWFDNLYPDGGREAVYSSLLLDLIGTDILSGEERLGLLSHLNDNEFLGPYSIYSMSRQNRVNWDRVDTDWGGGGSYTGIPMQLVRNLYQTGMGQLAWTILSRFTQYVDYFPYISQNLRADAPFQDESSMPMAICAGAGVEAIVFGLFGLSPRIDGALDIHPYYAHELGKASLNDFRFRGHSYDISMDRYGFRLRRDGKAIGSYHHGESVRIWRDGRIMNHDDMRVSIPTVETDQFVFTDRKEIVLKTATAGASIYYTLDGSPPNAQSTAYNGPFSISQSSQLKAIALHADLAASEISVIYFERADESDLESAPLMVKDFLISRSIHGYVGPEGRNEYPLDKSNMQWKRARVDERGIVWLSQQLTPFAHCHAFAVTEIVSDEAVAATLLTGTNDGAFIWLNGDLILDNYKERPLYYNQFSLPVNLREGKNTLVLMVNQAGGSWGFHVNLRTQGNKPSIVLPDLEN
jgi:Chitobiase/beta-hexosaminidase C-terminal domain